MEDSTYYYIKKLFIKGIVNIELLVDPDLEWFFKSKSGKIAWKIIYQNFKDENQYLTKPLLAFQLSLRLQEDQLIARLPDKDFFTFRNLDQREMEYLKETFPEKQKAHLEYLKRISKNYTYLPSRRAIGYVGLDAIFALVQHSGDIKILERFVSLFMENAKSDKFIKRYIAFMVDRTLLLKDEPQLYGTHRAKDGSGIGNVKDPENINKLRESMGLEPIHEEIIEKLKQ